MCIFQDFDPSLMSTETQHYSYVLNFKLKLNGVEWKSEKSYANKVLVEWLRITMKAACSAKIGNLPLGGAPYKALILMLVSIIYCLYIDATYCYLLHQFAHGPLCKIAHSGGKERAWGEGRGGELRNETLSVLPIQSILVSLCGKMHLFFLIGCAWRERNFSGLSVISGEVVFPV